MGWCGTEPEMSEEVVVVGIGGCPAGDPGAGQLRRSEALRHLPGAYSLALCLRDEGLPVDLIAECLAIEPEALDPLLDVAEAKLDAILRVAAPTRYSTSTSIRHSGEANIGKHCHDPAKVAGQSDEPCQRERGR